MRLLETPLRRIHGGKSRNCEIQMLCFLRIRSPRYEGKARDSLTCIEQRELVREHGIGRELAGQSGDEARQVLQVREKNQRKDRSFYDRRASPNRRKVQREISGISPFHSLHGANRDANRRSNCSSVAGYRFREELHYCSAEYPAPQTGRNDEDCRFAAARRHESRVGRRTQAAPDGAQEASACRRNNL